MNFVETLAGYGPLGVAFAMLVAAIIYLARDNNRIQQERIADFRSQLTQAVQQRDEVVRALTVAAQGLEDTREAVQTLTARLTTTRVPP